MSSGGFFFGANTTASKPTGTPASGGLFGNFGNTNVSNTTTPSTSFNPPNTGGSLFGSMTQQPQSISSQANTLPPSAPPTSFNTHPFQYIQQCLDPSSPNYRFRCFFYNPVPGGIISNPQIKPPLVSDRLWTQVKNDNPDPTQMVPVLANGFGDLSVRREWQSEHQRVQVAKLNELERRLNSVLTRQDLDVTTQLQIIQRQQLKLTLRVLKLMKQVEVMRRSGQRLNPQEQYLMGQLQELRDKLIATPSSPIHSLSLRQVQTKLQNLAASGSLDPLFHDKKALLLADPDSQVTIISTMTQQQAGLNILLESINQSIHDLDLMRHGYSTSGSLK